MEFQPAEEKCESAARILIVDDNEQAARSLARLLKAAGCETQAIVDSRQGLTTFSNFVPTLVFLDLGMPFIDGYELCKLIRGLPSGRNVKIFAITGWADEASRAKSAEAGFDLHLVKPVKLEVLLELIEPKANGARTVRATNNYESN